MALKYVRAFVRAVDVLAAQQNPPLVITQIQRELQSCAFDLLAPLEQDALRYIVAHPETTAEGVADAIVTHVSGCRTILNTLLLMGMVRREKRPIQQPRGGRNWEYRYFVSEGWRDVC